VKAKTAAKAQARTKARPQRRRRESREALAKRALEIVSRLRQAYPDARCALAHRNALELLVATILSAQCTDVRVNLVTPGLFRRFPDAAAFAAASSAELEAMIRSTGFFRAKAKSIQGACRAIAEQHRGRVPDRLEDLTPLPGVGRKTANVVLGNAYGVPGIVVDTHMRRLAQRLGLTRQDDPVKIEFELMPLIPRADWTWFSHAIITHGRQVCAARKPNCAGCVLRDLCPSALV
jgi:endonuclease-3